MSIQSLCILVELGVPFLNADWDSAKIPATGRMVSLGFEHLYHGEGWSDMFLLDSTCDFTMGTEFDRFATLEDRDALRNHSLVNAIPINGIGGLIRIQTGCRRTKASPRSCTEALCFRLKTITWLASMIWTHATRAIELI